MIKTLLATAALMISHAGYAVAQEAAPAAKMQQQPATATHYSLVMVSFVNNGAPQAVSPTTQTIIGTTYPTPDSCGKAAQGAWGAAPNPSKELKKETDILRLYFVCVASDK
jgi:hypothetical protein